MYNMKIEDSFIQIRDRLQKEGIKLWLPPYYNSTTGINEEKLKELAENYSISLKLEYKLCYDTLQKLLCNALEKLTQINRFKESGLATIKIKVLQYNGHTTMIIKEVSLNILGSDLKAIIHEEISVPLERLVGQAYIMAICQFIFLQPLFRPKLDNQDELCDIVLNASERITQQNYIARHMKYILLARLFKQK